MAAARGAGTEGWRGLGEVGVVKFEVVLKIGMAKVALREYDLC